MAENQGNSENQGKKNPKDSPESSRIVSDILINPLGKDGNYRLQITPINKQKRGLSGKTVKLYNHTKKAVFPFASKVTTADGSTFVDLQFSGESMDVKFVCDTVVETHNYLGPANQPEREITAEEDSLPWWKFALTMIFGKGGK